MRKYDFCKKENKNNINQLSDHISKYYPDSQKIFIFDSYEKYFFI